MIFFVHIGDSKSGSSSDPNSSAWFGSSLPHLIIHEHNSKGHVLLRLHLVKFEMSQCIKQWFGLAYVRNVWPNANISFGSHTIGPEDEQQTFGTHLLLPWLLLTSELELSAFSLSVLLSELDEIVTVSIVLLEVLLSSLHSDVVEIVTVSIVWFDMELSLSLSAAALVSGRLTMLSSSLDTFFLNCLLHCSLVLSGGGELVLLHFWNC